MRHYVPTLGIIFSVALNLAFLGSYAYRMLAQRSGYVYEEVQLTPDQRSRIIAGRDRFIVTIDQIGNNIIDLQVELIAAIAAEPADRNAIDARLDQIRAQQQLMQHAVVEHLTKDKEILKPDQRKQFFAVLKRRIQSQGVPGPIWLPRDRTRQP